MKKTALLLIIHDDKFVLFKRSPYNQTFVNQYGLIGGEINHNESAREAIKREAKEEISINLTNVDFIKKYYFKNEIIFLYYTEIESLNGISLNKEHDSFKEFTIDEMENDSSVIKTNITFANDYIKKYNPTLDKLNLRTIINKDY